MNPVTEIVTALRKTSATDRFKTIEPLGIQNMQLTTYGQQPTGEQQYARIESMILDLQLGISSVRRANGCLDLHTVRQIRARAAKTLGNVDEMLTQYHPDTWQKQRVTERRRALTQLLGEPAPIERVAESLRVG